MSQLPQITNILSLSQTHTHTHTHTQCALAADRDNQDEDSHSARCVRTPGHFLGRSLEVVDIFLVDTLAERVEAPTYRLVSIFVLDIVRCGREDDEDVDSAAVDSRRREHRGVIEAGNVVIVEELVASIRARSRLEGLCALEQVLQLNVGNRQVGNDGVAIVFELQIAREGDHIRLERCVFYFLGGDGGSSSWE